MNKVGICTFCGGAMIVDYNMVNETPHCEDCGSFRVYQPEYDTGRDPGDEDDLWGV